MLGCHHVSQAIINIQLKRASAVMYRQVHDGKLSAIHPWGIWGERVAGRVVESEKSLSHHHFMILLQKQIIIYFEVILKQLVGG